jgi:hypothetical protein
VGGSGFEGMGGRVGAVEEDALVLVPGFILCEPSCILGVGLGVAVVDGTIPRRKAGLVAAVFMAWDCCLTACFRDRNFLRLSVFIFLFFSY